MPLPSLRRRIGKLEIELPTDCMAGYPPLSFEQIEALVAGLADGGRWTAEEEAQVARQCPVIQGELLITASRGEVLIKRYPGVDLAWI